jgi:outer membrane protein OmpA-like peptidoglycan-associated protein
MKCNWRRWLWGLIPLIMASWMAVQVERGRIEQDLSERAATMLKEGGAGWAGIAMSGRDLVLSGRAAEDSEPAKAVDQLRALWGVRVVDNKTQLSPQVETFVWAAGRRNARIRITGYAPNRVTRQAILGVAKANFPGFEVVDRMTVARGLNSADTWMAGVSFALKQLSHLSRGDVRLENLGLTVIGEAEDGPGYKAVKAALAGGLPNGIKLIADQVTAPVVSPYGWGARLASGQLTLTGHVPSDAARGELLSAAKAAAGAVSVVDRMEPGEGAPQGFAAAAVASVKGLMRLETGSAELKDAALTVAGMAQDEAAAEAARAGLKGAMPASIKLTDQIKAREPPPPPPAVALAPNGPDKGTVKSDAPPAQKAADAAPVRPVETAPPAVAPTAPVEPPPAKAAEAAPARPADPPAKAAEAAPVVPSPPPAKAAEPTVVAPPPPPAAKAAEAAAPVVAPPPAKAAEATPVRPADPPPAKAAETASVAPLAAPSLSPAELRAQAQAKACKESLDTIQDKGLIHFNTGSAELDRSSFETLDKLAGAAKLCPGMRIVIEGHTDAEGPAEYNQLLSVRRAQAVARYLVRAGADAQQLEATGYGDRKPKMPNDTIENMAKNRRIEFEVRPQ